jgi:hypothetical protein
MGLLNTSFYVEMVSMGECINCGVPICAPSPFKEKRLKDHSKMFYCINGHAQHYIGKTEAEKLNDVIRIERSRNEFTRARLEREQNSHRATRGHLTRVKKRIASGVCPCCNRTFQNVARHMKTQHPGYGT